jgi:hypothetical protein
LGLLRVNERVFVSDGFRCCNCAKLKARLGGMDDLKTF